MYIQTRPDIIIKAKQAGLPVRAFWLWQYAKHICRARGTVPEQALIDSLKALKVSRTSRYRWIGEAVKTGLLRLEVNKRTGLVYYRLASWGEGAIIAGCRRTGKPAPIELERFVSHAWVPEVWAGYRLQVGGRTENIALLSKDQNGRAVVTVVERKAKPISRNTLTELTGVSRRAQQYRERKAGVEQVENYLIIRDDDTGFKKFGHDKEHPELGVRDGKLVQRLPNSVDVPERVKLSRSTSKTRKINKALRVLCESDATAQGEHYPRMYADSFEHAIKLRDEGVIYPTGKLLTSKPDEPIKQSWRRLQYASM